MKEINFDEMSNEELIELVSFETFRFSMMLKKNDITNITGTENISIIEKMIEKLKKIQSLYIELERRKKLFVV